MLVRDWVDSIESQGTYSDGLRPTDFERFCAGKQSDRTEHHSALFITAAPEAEQRHIVLVANDCHGSTGLFRNLVDSGAISAPRDREGVAFLELDDRLYVLENKKCAVIDEIELDRDLSWIKVLAGELRREAKQEKIDYLHQKINKLMVEGKFDKVDRAIEQITKTQVSYEIIVGAIRFTRKARKEIPNWEQHAELAAQRVNSLGLNSLILLGSLD